MSLITIIDYLGTLVFAISGIMVAINKKFDLFGAITLGIVTAIGGGTLRDLMIGQTPVSWLEDETYIYLILSAIPLCYFFNTQIQSWRKGLFLFDTIGIGLFTILGMEKTLNAGLSPTIAVMMGVVSAVFGGVIRDVLANKVPLIFQKEIYASACLIGALVYLGMLQFLSDHFSMVVSIGVVILIRILAIKRHWELPYVKQ